MAEQVTGSQVAKQEIERKFIVDGNAAKLILGIGHAERKSSGDEIRQGYLAIDDEDKSEVRIRDTNGSYTQTVKLGSGLVRGEVEFALSEEQFQQLWPLTNGKVVEKTRYRLYDQQHVIEVDFFRGALHGLVMAEVEFDSEQEAGAFEMQDWFEKDVTTNPLYKNQALARQNQARLVK